MSKSLTINAPQIVQTRDTLNAVPSGSTTTPDENVKYVPQTLTDAQKAQARQNIGAAADGGGGTQVQSDWNQTDDTQPDYIKNKPTSLGGSAPEIDTYWTVYTKGDTTLTAESGTIDEVWMNGVELTAQNNSYSLSAGSVVRVSTTGQISFNFSNTTDEIWIWVPKSVIAGGCIYGTRTNVNLVYFNESKSNQTFDFGGKIWLMTSKVWNNWLYNNATIIFADTAIDMSNLPDTTTESNTSYLVIPQKRLDEFNTQLGNQYGGSLNDLWWIAHKTNGYGYLVQNGYELFMKNYTFDESECFKMYYQRNQIRYSINRGGDGTKLYGITQEGKQLVLNPVTDPAYLQPGQYVMLEENTYVKPFQTNADYVCFAFKTIQVGSYETTTGGALVWPENPINVYIDGHTMINCDYAYLNNTVIFPAWLSNTLFFSSYDNTNLTKAVYLCKNLTGAIRVGGVTEVILTNTSVPGSVFDTVSDSNVTKVWLPKATYDLAIVDSNWSVYASKLKPYEYLVFGPNNYCVPVESLPLTMTDANGNTIDGDFVAQNVTITPAV